MADNREFRGEASGTFTVDEFGDSRPFTCYLQSLAFYTDDTYSVQITPAVGNFRVQFRAGSDGIWRDFDQSAFNELQYQRGRVPMTTGTPIMQIRIIFSGLPAGTHFIGKYYLNSEPDSALDPRIYEGDQFLSTQNSPEANSKRGTQFEFATRLADLAQLTPKYIGFETGDLPVIIKQRDIFGGFINADFEVFKGAEYTGGSPGVYSNNNDLIDNSGGVAISIAPTVTVEGLLFGSATPLIGTEGVGGRQITTFGDAAGEKILAPNTKYLAKFTNLNLTAISLLGFRLYWYEGPLSTQI